MGMYTSGSCAILGMLHEAANFLYWTSKEVKKGRGKGKAVLLELPKSFVFANYGEFEMPKRGRAPVCIMKKSDGSRRICWDDFEKIISTLWGIKIEKMVRIKCKPGTKEMRSLFSHPRLSWNQSVIKGIQRMGSKRKKDMPGEALISNYLGSEEEEALKSNG